MHATGNFLNVDTRITDLYWHCSFLRSTAPAHSGVKLSVDDLQQHANLFLLAPIDAVVDSSVTLLVFQNQFLCDQFVENVLNRRGGLANLAVQQPPFDNALQRVLRLRVLEQVGQQSARYFVSV